MNDAGTCAIDETLGYSYLIMGMGPVQTIQTEVDEKGQPVSRGGGGGRGRGAQP